MRARSIILTVHRLSSVVVQHGPVSGDAILKNRVTCQSASEGQTGCALVLFRDDPAANADGQVSHPTGRISFDSIADALPFHGAGCARRGVALVEGGVVGLVGGGRRQEIPASSAALGRARRRLRDWLVPLVQEDGGRRAQVLPGRSAPDGCTVEARPVSAGVELGSVWACARRARHPCASCSSPPGLRQFATGAAA